MSINTTTKKKCYTEFAYLAGIIILAFGTALMERADFGMSMVVAPAYLVYRKVSLTYSFFSFGMAEYCLQALLLILLCVVLRKAKVQFLFSFATAVFYGIVLDFMIMTAALIPSFGMAGRFLFYILGMVFCSIGVAFLFHTYIAPEAYELFVKEIAGRYRFSISKTKTVYDCCSCLIAIVMSFVFFGIGHFEGVKVGTIFCALINGWMIGQISRMMEEKLEFSDGWKLRRWFT